MSLRIECLTNTFVITKVLVKIDDVLSVKQMSNILCVSERTVLRRIVEYGLKIRNFFNIYGDQLDSDVLALTKDYSFYGETDLREFLKGYHSAKSFSLIDLEIASIASARFIFSLEGKVGLKEEYKT